MTSTALPRLSGRSSFRCLASLQHHRRQPPRDHRFVSHRALDPIDGLVAKILGLAAEFQDPLPILSAPAQTVPVQSSRRVVSLRLITGRLVNRVHSRGRLPSAGGVSSSMYRIDSRIGAVSLKAAARVDGRISNLSKRSTTSALRACRAGFAC